MPFNTPYLLVRNTDKGKDEIVITLDIIDGTLDVDTVLNEIDEASISYEGSGTACNQRPYARYKLITRGRPMRCLFTLNAIRATIEGDDAFRQKSIDEAAQLLS